MTGTGYQGTIEVVRGQLEGERAQDVLRFWADQGVLEGDAAEQRLSEVVCVLVDDSGEILGVNSAHEEAIPLIGGRRFWVYRAYLAAGTEAENEMLNAAFEALDESYRATRSGPIGIAVMVSHPEEMRLRPEAVWPETELMYAGMTPDGRQVRVRYFYDATVGPGYPNSPSIAESEAQDYSLAEGYRIVPLAETDAAGPDDVLELWAREGVLPEAEAHRRVHEVLMVVLDPEDGIAGVSTVYLQRNPQLKLDLWYLRGYVSTGNRLANVAVRMLWASRDHLSERFLSGEDRRAPGIVMEIENEGLMRYFNRAFWVYSNFWFIGENPDGAHVRVHYFPGARAPEPG